MLVLHNGNEISNLVIMTNDLEIFDLIDKFI